jgi:hypothetical protein
VEIDVGIIFQILKTKDKEKATSSSLWLLALSKSKTKENRMLKKASFFPHDKCHT